MAGTPEAVTAQLLERLGLVRNELPDEVEQAIVNLAREVEGNG